MVRSLVLRNGFGLLLKEFKKCNHNSATSNSPKSASASAVQHRSDGSGGRFHRIAKVGDNHAYTLSPLIGMSATLRRLVDLGVDLAGLEEIPQVGNLLMQLDFQRDVLPRLQLLTRYAQLDAKNLSKYVTGNPWIFKQDMDLLNQRFTYLESKGFSQAAVARIVTAARYWLNLDIKVLDQRLGWLQSQFELDADELRLVVTKNPKLITLGTGHIELIQFSLLEEMGFARKELKVMLLKEPFLFSTYKDVLRQAFEFVHNTLQVPHQRILEFPRILRCYGTQLKARHLFLEKHNRAQYDPHKANYVSLISLAEGSDETFCQNVAHCSVNEFNSFLKRQL